jgi:hypothetical protein
MTLTFCTKAGCVDPKTDTNHCGGCANVCSAGMACVGGQCGPNGASCTTPADCANGHCIGGICCASACTDQGAMSCGQKGTCSADGSTCLRYPAGTVCGSPSCSGVTLTPAPTCDGNGACTVKVGSPCAGNFKCATATTCKTQCNANTDCSATKYICGTITATAKQCLLAPGQPCTIGNQCASDGCSGSGCL